jgi:hypothetical protein
MADRLLQGVVGGDAEGPEQLGPGMGQGGLPVASAAMADSSWKPANRCWTSLQVTPISSCVGGWRVCWVRAATTRKAWAKHGQGGPAVPGAPAADLMLVQAAQTLAGLEGLFNPPTTMHL